MGMGMGNDKHVQTKGRPFVEAGRLGRLPDGPDLKAKQVLESCLLLLAPHKNSSKAAHYQVVVFLININYQYAYL